MPPDPPAACAELEAGADVDDAEGEVPPSVGVLVGRLVTVGGVVVDVDFVVGAALVVVGGVVVVGALVVVGAG